MAQRYDFVREEVILQELSTHGRVTVNDLARRLCVSTVTVRKDLDLLEQRSLLRRVRGGAVVRSTGDEGAFCERLRQDSGLKRQLARHAAALVEDGDVLAIDSSTTCHYLARELLDHHDLVVVTNGMHTAMLFLEHSDATVIVTGGMLRRAAGSMVGAFANALQGRGRIEKGFFGVTALSTELGLLEISSEEAEVKKALAASCGQIYGLFTASKTRGFGLYPFADCARITALITDEQADAGFVAAWRAAGVAVSRVEGTAAVLADGRRAADIINATDEETAIP